MTVYWCSVELIVGHLYRPAPIAFPYHPLVHGRSVIRWLGHNQVEIMKGRHKGEQVEIEGKNYFFELVLDK